MRYILHLGNGIKKIVKKYFYKIGQYRIKWDLDKKKNVQKKIT